MSDPALIEGCKIWDELTKKLNRGYPVHIGERTPKVDDGFYASQDYKPLKCRIRGRKAEVTVGSSPGHRVHIDNEEKTLEYYDNDMKVNHLISYMLNQVDGDCRSHSEGVSCNIARARPKDIFRVLAHATSMDLRIDDCEEDCKWREYEFFSELLEHEES